MLRSKLDTATKAFEDESHYLISSALSKCKIYAEFGAGASTLVASEKENIKSIASAETDAIWADFLLDEIGTRKLKVVLVDLGPVGNWGRPIGYSRADKFELYFKAPFRSIRSPDLVYIDGRFRVACFLTTLLFAKPGTTVIFDDYVDRPHYHIVEKIVIPEVIRGRQAQFSVGSDLNRSQVEDLLQKFIYVMD